MPFQRAMILKQRATSLAWLRPQRSAVSALACLQKLIRRSKLELLVELIQARYSSYFILVQKKPGSQSRSRFLYSGPGTLLISGQPSLKGVEPATSLRILIPDYSTDALSSSVISFMVRLILPRSSILRTLTTISCFSFRKSVTFSTRS